MRQRKQILSILLVTSMLSTMLAGCGEAKEPAVEDKPVSSSESQPAAESSETSSEAESASEETDSIRISEETITLTVEGPSGGTAYDWTNSQQFQEYEKRLGIRFEATTWTNEQWSNRLTLMMAGDEMPDVLMTSGNMTQAQVEMYGSDGYLLDFSQYLDVMPNVKRLLETSEDFKNMSTFSDGGMYGFPRYNETATLPCASMPYNFVNGAWLENLGLDRPTTVDEFYDVLVAFKEQDANGNGDPDDEVPFGIRKDAYHDALKPVSWAFGIHSTKKNYHLNVDENGQLGIWDTTDMYKEYLRFVHKLYDEKLINQDAFVLENAELSELINENKVGAFFSYSFDSSREHVKDFYVPVGYIHEGYNTESVVVYDSNVTDNYFIVANANIEYPEEIAKFVDYLFTEEGQLSARNGYEGVTFDFKELAPGYGIADHAQKAAENGYTDTNAYRQEKALALNAVIPYVAAWGTIYGAIPYIEDLKSDEIWPSVKTNGLKEIANRENPNTKHIQGFQNLLYTSDEVTERATLYTDISNYLGTSFVQFVTGEMDIDADWNNYLSELDKMGLKKLLEIDQAAYDRVN